MLLIFYYDWFFDEPWLLRWSSTPSFWRLRCLKLIRAFDLEEVAVVELSLHGSPRYPSWYAHLIKHELFLLAEDDFVDLVLLKTCILFVAVKVVV